MQQPVLLQLPKSVRWNSTSHLKMFAVKTNCLFSIDAVHAELRKKEFMDTMIKLLDPSEPHDVQEEAAFAIANMCVDCE